MARFFAISFALFIITAAAPASAQRVIFLDLNGPPTSDPAHVGYALKPGAAPI